jgi:adenylate cyclase
MGREIERKFLVKGDGWRSAAKGTPFCQGYLSIVPERTVRVRSDGRRGWITIKGRSQGSERAEFEYEIPAADADTMLRTLCRQPLIEKTRYRVEHGGRVWEVDEFAGDNAGLVLAEIELDDAAEAVDLPDWVGREVTNSGRYTNARLSVRPYRRR